MTSQLPGVKLQGDDLLDAYKGRAAARSESDWDKLAFLGGKLLDVAITYHWLSKADPPLSIQEIVDKLDGFLENDNLLQHCVEQYELEKYLVDRTETTVSTQDCKDFLCINVAKLWEQGGMAAVQKWVSALIEPGSVPPREPQASSPRGGIESEVPRLDGIHISPQNPPEPSASILHVAPPNQPASGDPIGFITLQIFNEHAVQKKKHTVTWSANSSGNAHCLVWTAECLLDGRVRGVGQGTSKKSAMEMAAREVWRAMGWGFESSPVTATPSPESPTVSSSTQSSAPPAYPPQTGSDESLGWLTLSIFNHVANQHRLRVEWRQEHGGEPHMPIWRVVCIVNGEEKGSGTGRNTKEAKVTAAREAWRTMGWSMTPT